MLLRKLGLSKEFQRARLVTNDREVVELREKVVACRNNHEIGKAREILGQIREKVSVEIPENRQYFIDAELALDRMEGKMVTDKFVKKEREALQCTLNTDKLHYTDELYLTEMEIHCIRNMIQGLTDTEKRKCIDFLLHFFERYEKEKGLGDSISVYAYVIVCVANELGNLGEYKIATELDEKVLREELMCKRIWELDSIIYDITWNENEQSVKTEMRKNKMTESLEECIILSHFYKRTFGERFYRDKMNQV